MLGSPGFPLLLSHCRVADLNHTDSSRFLCMAAVQMKLPG